ncbi:MAG: hypothetical protein PHN33_03250 [Candidatus Peribacteraceae bacterium]|nr:hypothetical protein [Candidatus Peribacteraceae bacterium]
MPAEKPSVGVAESGERGPLFGGELDALEKTLGPRVKPLPAEITERWIEQELKDIVKDQRVDTYNEQTRYNELLYRRAALQRLKDLQQEKNDGKPLDTVKLQELIVADQAVAYHEYFREAQDHVLSVLRMYEKLRAGVSVVPQGILQKEADTERYVGALQEATQERVAFSNVLLLDQQIAEGFGNREASLRLREQYVRELASASRAALNGSDDQKLIRANQLNQRIIDILGGEHGLQGIEAGYVPKRMVLDFLKYRYKNLLDQQNEIARDPSLTATRTEMDRLELKSKLAEQGKGEFTVEDKSRYDVLQARVQSVDAQFKALGEKRRDVTDQILSLTQDLGEYNIAQTELAAIQEQFGKKYSFEGVVGLSPLTTPPEIRDAIAKNMEMRKAHHLGQMNNFLEKVEKDMLDPGLKEEMEDLWNKNGREAVRKVIHRLADFFTFAAPEKFGMKEAAKDALTEPLDEALGWPAGKERWEELTDAEKQRVQQKATSILDLIEKFDRTKVQNFRTSIVLLQSLKPPSAATLETVKFDEQGQAVLSEERVTASNINALIGAHGEATVYLMLMRQLHGDFGADQPPSGFMGEYAEFLHGVNKNIDVHIDVGRACNILGKRFGTLSNWLLILAAFGLVLVAIGGTVIVMKVGGKAARAVGSGLWQGTKWGARQVKKFADALGEESGLRIKSAAKPSVKPSTPAVSTAEKVAEGSSRTSRVGKVLGPLGIVLVTADLRRVMLRDARLQPLREFDGIQTALEMWNNKEITAIQAPRHDKEVVYLEYRLQCLVMEDGAARLAQEIEKRKQKGLLPEIAETEELQDRCERVRKSARQGKMRYERLLPITDYLITDTDGPEGNVGIDRRNIDEARQRGMKYEEQMRLLDDMHAMGNRRKGGRKEMVIPRGPDLSRSDDLQAEYQKLLEDAAEFLERNQK